MDQVQANEDLGLAGRQRANRVEIPHFLEQCFSHVVRQDHGLTIAEVGADQIAIVDPAIIDVLAGLHLGLQLLDHVAFLDQVMIEVLPDSVGPSSTLDRKSVV